jgi:1-acyl-sn-glycerol-3-phosphate acyltransferase
MLYRMFRALARLTLAIFFRRIEVEGREQLPLAGPLLFVPNHANALVDPLVLMVSLGRPLTVTAKNVLAGNPLLRFLMSALGVVTFHRREDVGKGADVRQNVSSLERCREILARGGALCIFPEGISHSDPKLRPFHTGPARIALDYIRKDGNPGGLRIVPVGLLYTEKDRFRSAVWLRFGTPLEAGRWVAQHPDATAQELTAEICRRIEALTLNFETRRESAILSWAADILAPQGAMPPPLGRDGASAADWFRLVGRLQAGYRFLLERRRHEIDELTTRVRRYRAELKRDGIEPGEVYLPLRFGKALLFAVREIELLLVGAPLALFGIVNHLLPYWIVKRIASKLSKDKDQWASNVVYPAFVVFPFFYLLQIGAAWLFLEPLWAFVYTLALPYTGYHAVLYTERAGQALRRTRTFLSFVTDPGKQERLAREGREIIGRIRQLGTELEGNPPPGFQDRARAFRQQLDDDCATLRAIVPGLERLEAAMRDAQQAIQARQRGYFTPDEDDQVRRLLLAYRNYRLALYEIIEHATAYEQLRDPAQQLRTFMIGYAAALTLYARSLALIEAYERQPLIREKLNEPDARFDLESGFFDQVLGRYTSLWNYRRIARAGRFWLRRRRQVRALHLADDPQCGWLVEVIRRQRAGVQKAFWSLLLRRLGYDRRAAWRSLVAPVHNVRYGMQALIGGKFAGLRTSYPYEPALDRSVLESLASFLRPGDVLMVRAEHKITTALLPGFWSHAALFLGDQHALKQLRLDEHFPIPKHRDVPQPDRANHGLVLEAISAGVVISPLEKCLHADHVLVLRPNVSEADRLAALVEGLSHAGKAYDFEFDFNVTTRLVCTELIYRCYHRRGGMAFSLIKRLGRFTLSGDDLVGQILEQTALSGDACAASLQPIALVLQASDGKAYFMPQETVLDTLRAIQAGLRPSVALPPPGRLEQAAV